eukprot:Nk52_evm8s1315 gene=Nk52_evmTU8s1315
MKILLCANAFLLFISLVSAAVIPGEQSSCDIHWAKTSPTPVNVSEALPVDSAVFRSAMSTSLDVWIEQLDFGYFYSAAQNTTNGLIMCMTVHWSNGTATDLHGYAALENQTTKGSCSLTQSLDVSDSDKFNNINVMYAQLQGQEDGVNKTYPGYAVSGVGLMNTYNSSAGTPMVSGTDLPEFTEMSYSSDMLEFDGAWWTSTFMYPIYFPLYGINASFGNRLGTGESDSNEGFALQQIQFAMNFNQF